ncbi:MAG: ABC transporter permease [Gemmatimonadaceae bacterium]|nr:ABC transporter permease [Gemmatimonadaceae bacterium]
MTMPTTSTGSWQSIVHRLRGDRRSVVAAAVLLGMIVLVLVGPLLSPFAPYEQIDITNRVHQPPSATHLLGTDAYSRDVFSRVLSGGRVSLAVAASAVLIETFVGILWGLGAGLAGGRIDTVMMRCVDAGMSVPRVLLLLAMLAAVPIVPVWLLVVLLGVTGWFGIARLVRGEVRAIRGADYVLAARTLGAGPARLAMRHVLPQVLGPVLVASTLAIGQVIVLEAGMSWLGIGVRPPQASWGNIIGDGTEFIASAPWVSLGPGCCLVIVVLAVSALGDGLRDALAPRQLPRT